MSCRYYLSFIILPLSFLCLFTSTSFGGNYAVSFKWKSIKTRHFNINYHPEIEDIALQVSGYAEEIYSVVRDELGWESEEKVEIIIADNTDFSSGRADIFPFNHITINPIPPLIDMLELNYDVWLKFVLLHEYIHIVQVDSVKGIYKVFRRIFGKVMSGTVPNILSMLSSALLTTPNIFLPRWFLEGLATWAETEFSNNGRGRDTFFEMICRMAVYENNLLSIGQINGDIPFWPKGKLPYIYGLKMHQYISEEMGMDKLIRLTEGHSSRFPFFINGNALKVLRRDYYDIYEASINRLVKEQRTKIERLAGVPLTQFSLLTRSGELNTGPRFYKDSKGVIYTEHANSRHKVLKIIDVDSLLTKDIIWRYLSDNYISLSRDGRYIYFAQGQISNGFNIYQDIFRFDIENKALYKMTNGIRAAYPDVSPDGKRLVYVQNKDGKQNISIYDLENGREERYVFNTFSNQRLATPRWSNDGKHIVFTMTEEGKGDTNIFIYDLISNKYDKLTNELCRNITPVWSNDGAYIIYSSDRTGVFNLYGYDIKEKVNYQITHVMGGTFQPDISPDGKQIVFVSYGVKGFDLAIMDYDKTRWTSKPSPSIEIKWAAGNRKTIISPSAINATDIEKKITDYSPFPSLLPQFWAPDFLIDHKGIGVGGYTAGNDPLRFHRYFLNFVYGVESREAYYSVQYHNDIFYPSISLLTSSRPLLYTSLFNGKDYFERSSQYDLRVNIPLNDIESAYIFVLGYQFQRKERLTDDLTQRQIPFEGDLNNIYGGIIFKNTRLYPLSITREDGRRLRIEARYYSDITGSNIYKWKLISDYNEYLSIREDYSSRLRFRLKTGISGGEQIAQSAFQIGGYTDYQLIDTGQEEGNTIRGYPVRSIRGRYMLLSGMEYIFPISYIFYGLGTAPLFFDKLFGTFFIDAANVWQGHLLLDQTRLGTGIEIRQSMVVGYNMLLIPAIGFAQGITGKEGESQLYLLVRLDF